MGAFMPMGIARSIEGAVDQERGECPPAAPSEIRDGAAAQEEDNPRPEIHQTGQIAAPHQFPQGGARDARSVPGLLNPALDVVIVERNRSARPPGEPIGLVRIRPPIRGHGGALHRTASLRRDREAHPSRPRTALSVTLKLRTRIVNLNGSKGLIVRPNREKGDGLGGSLDAPTLPARWARALICLDLLGFAWICLDLLGFFFGCGGPIRPLPYPEKKPAQRRLAGPASLTIADKDDQYAHEHALRPRPCFR